MLQTSIGSETIPQFWVNSRCPILWGPTVCARFGYSTATMKLIAAGSGFCGDGTVQSWGNDAHSPVVAAEMVLIDGVCLQSNVMMGTS